MKILLDTLKNKKSDINRKYCVHCPNPNDICDWDIEDARGHGIPHNIFYDTRNKISIFPNHILCFKDLFTTDSFGWRSWDGWEDEPELCPCGCKESGDRIYVHSFQILCNLRDKIKEKGIDAYLINVYGSCKGYVNASIDFPLDEENEDFLRNEMALWVFTERNDIEKLI